MPEYRMVHWDTERFDINSNRFVREACAARKWAFATDYIRLHALYTEGGIYLDCDVAVRKPFDEFLVHGVFTAVEYHRDSIRNSNTLSMVNPDGTSKTPHTRKPGIGIQAAVIAAEVGHPFIKECLDWYQDRQFILEDGNYDENLIAPDIYAMVAESHGFRYVDTRQTLGDDVLVLPSEYFAPALLQATEYSHAIHLCANSWIKHQRSPLQLGLDKLRRNSLLRTLFRKKVVRPFAGIK